MDYNIFLDDQMPRTAEQCCISLTWKWTILEAPFHFLPAT